LKTIVPSPLRRWLGDKVIVARPGLRVDTWVGFGCGDIVHTRDNPRHQARVIAIFDGVTARVCWLDNGWKTDCAIADLVKS
jgi:hypothetical protein